MIRSMSQKKARLSVYADVIVYMDNYRESKRKGDREGKGGGGGVGRERDMKLKQQYKTNILKLKVLMMVNCIY